MSITETEALAAKLRQRALARLSLKTPTARDRADAALDEGAADAIIAALCERDRLLAENQRLHGAIRERDAVIAELYPAAREFARAALERQSEGGEILYCLHAEYCYEGPEADDRGSSNDPMWHMMFVPKTYWERERCMPDQHWGFILEAVYGLPNWIAANEGCENMFSVDEKTKEEMEQALVGCGFQFNQEVQDFCNSSVYCL